MQKDIDVRGLACPAPVLQTKTAIDQKSPAGIKVLVDNEAAEQNVIRFLESQHYDTSVEKDGKDFHITGNRQESAKSSEGPVADMDKEKKRIMVMITFDCLGHGDNELGTKLMASFLKTLKEMGDDLWRLVLLNNGVKMTAQNTEKLSALKELEESGISILVCGTCLDHFNLLDKKQVGETTNMMDIVTAMQLADKVINL